MTLSVNFIERKYGDTPSIERVFDRVGTELKALGLEVSYEKLPYGNGLVDIFRNLLFFKPKFADIQHITGQSTYIGLVSDPTRTVMTIHDLEILNTKKGLRRSIIKVLFFSLPLKKIRWVTAVSKNTRNEIEKNALKNACDVHVIENPILVRGTRTRKEFNSVSPTILQIGTAENKNLRNLFRALEGIDCRLEIVGKLSDLDRSSIVNAGISYREHGTLDSEGIERVYSGADIVTFCSKSEGFGLPIIEAQAFGIPVVTSNRDPMRDIAGGGAVLVEPEDPYSIKKGIQDITDDAELRQTIVEIGFKNIQRFEPEFIAAKYLDLYSAVIGESRGK